MITDTVMRMGIGAVARQRVGFPIDVVFIGLLRGINVGGRNKLAMQDLRSICESLGWKKVRTYIQSGNVVFETPRAKPGRLAEQLADALEEHMSVRLAVLVRTAVEFEAVVENNAFARRRTLDPSHVVVVFLERTPSRASRDALLASVKGREELHFHRRELYVYYRDGIARSKLTNAVIERTLDTAATARNLNTACKLAALADAARASGDRELTGAGP